MSFIIDRPTQVFDYAEMAARGILKYTLPEYMVHVRKCIADASVFMRIEWFESVQQLFQQVIFNFWNTQYRTYINVHD